MPFLTLYLFKNTHISITLIGIIVGLQPLALCYGSVIGGYASDIFKRHTIILISVVLSCLVYMSFYLSGKYLVAVPQMIVFGLLNLLNGLCTALFSPASRAVLSETACTPQENAKFLHMRYLALNLGGAGGPLVGAYAGVSGNIQAFIITAILYFIYALILFFVLRNYSSAKKVTDFADLAGFATALKLLAKNKLFISLIMSLTLFNVIYVQLSSNMALVINKNIIDGTIFFSWMLSLNALMVVLLQPAIYFIIRNRNQRVVIMYGFLIILLVSLAVIFLPVNKSSVLFFVAGLTVAEVLVFPTSSILVTQITPEQYRGTAFGAIDFEYFGSAIGPALGGIIMQYFSAWGFFAGICIISCLCILTYWPCIKQPAI